MPNSRPDSDSDFSVPTVESLSTLAGKGKQILTESTFRIQDTDHMEYKTSMICQLDTGALCNVISYQDLSILLQNGALMLDQSCVKLKMYDGSGNHETSGRNLFNSRTWR